MKFRYYEMDFEVAGLLIRGRYFNGRASREQLVKMGNRFPYVYEMYAGENTRHGGLSASKVADADFTGMLILVGPLDAYMNGDGEIRFEGEENEGDYVGRIRIMG